MNKMLGYVWNMITHKQKEGDKKKASNIQFHKFSLLLNLKTQYVGLKGSTG